MFFALDGEVNIGIILQIHDFIHRIFMSEAVSGVESVLKNSSSNMISHADIQRAMGFVCENIDLVVAKAMGHIPMDPETSSG